MRQNRSKKRQAKRAREASKNKNTETSKHIPLTPALEEIIPDLSHAIGTPMAPGMSRPTGTLKLKDSTSGEPAEVVTASEKLRAGFYVDGFNLYHAIDSLRSEAENRLPHLKWLDLRKLCALFIDKKTEVIERILWCSAYPTKTVQTDADKQALQRHRAYVKALEATRVEVLMGHFNYPTIDCPLKGCDKQYVKPNEKCTDINLALHAVDDALFGKVDVVYIMSADSDQAATASFIRQRKPDLKIVAIAPPGREHSQDILSYTSSDSTISLDNLEACLLPKIVLKGGKHAVDRPARYDPPVRVLRPRKKIA
jgi:NYN domain